MDKNVMGAARSALTRSIQGPVRNQRQIDKVLDGRPTLAPKHETTRELLDAAKQENQNNFDLHDRRSNDYLDLLKNIQVNSVNVKSKSVQESVNKSSQMALTTGKLSSEQLKFLFQQRMQNPDEWSAETIASYFKLPQNSVENLLKYYGEFSVEEAPKLPEPLSEITY